jgi:hypothetical protein
MKSLYLLFLIIALSASVLPAHAGFFVKKNSIVHSGISVSGKSGDAAASIIPNRIHRMRWANGYEHHRFMKREWIGVTALVTAMMGLFVPGVGILAIALGAIALRRSQRVRGLGLAALLMGVGETILFFLAMTTVVALVMY